MLAIRMRPNALAMGGKENQVSIRERVIGYRLRNVLCNPDNGRRSWRFLGIRKAPSPPIEGQYLSVNLPTGSVVWDLRSGS
jgi:hypothetical protein